MKKHYQKNCLIIAIAFGLITAIGICFMSCGSNFYCPETKYLKQIEAEKYILGINDCVDKSIKYSLHLDSKGIENRVMGGYHNEHPHTWVEVKKDNVWYMVDPTFEGYDGFPVEQYTNRKRHYVYVGPKIDGLKSYRYKIFWDENIPD